MNDKIICKPKPTISEMIELIQGEILAPPDEITINVTLKGVGAKRFYFISKVLEASTGESKEEIEKFLLRAGVEREMAKISMVMQHLNQEDVSEQGADDM